LVNKPQPVTAASLSDLVNNPIGERLISPEKPGFTKIADMERTINKTKDGK
jgi:hypothetical protein